MEKGQSPEDWSTSLPENQGEEKGQDRIGMCQSKACKTRAGPVMPWRPGYAFQEGAGSHSLDVVWMRPRRLGRF